VVVGAGPAGAALGLELARRGRGVLILERSRFPRDKPCGDCVNPGALAELRRLGVAERLHSVLAPQPLRGWQVEAPDGRAFRVAFGEDADGATLEGWAVRRREFDAVWRGPMGPTGSASSVCGVAASAATHRCPEVPTSRS
jgi:flavin-dependent dehydrogenase